MTTRHTATPRCLVAAHPARLLAANLLYDIRNHVLPILGELLAGVLLIGGAAVLVPLILLALA